MTAPEPPEEVRQAARRADERDGDLGRGADADSEAVAIEDFSYETDGDRLVVSVTARNGGVRPSVALVQVDVRTRDERTVTVERFVSLPPGGRTTVRFSPDVAPDEFVGLSPRILQETPATPLPTATGSTGSDSTDSTASTGRSSGTEAGEPRTTPADGSPSAAGTGSTSTTGPDSTKTG